MANSLTEKKRILLVVRWPVGGIRTFMRYVYTRFDPEQWHFTIVAPDHSELDELADDLKNCDVDFVLTESRPSAFKYGLTIFKQLVTQRFDLIHSHGFTSAICAALPSRLMFCKHIITSHDILNAEQFVGVAGQLKHLALNAALRTASVVHSVSHDAQDNLLSFFPSLRKRESIVIPNGIEVERFLQASPKNLCSDDAFLIGFFGRFMSQKGFRYLVEAIELLASDATLTRQPLVLAFGWGGFVEREKREIKEKGLEKYFRFMPFEPNVAGAIKGVDVVVMPSLWEACGLLAMETLVCGTPLIATDCIGLREVVAGTPAIQIPLRDARTLANEVSRMMKGDCVENFKDFSTKAAMKYDVKYQAAEIMHLYTSVTDGDHL